MMDNDGGKIIKKMFTEDVFSKRWELESEKEQLKQKMKKLDYQHKELIELCSHEIVVEFKDNHPRKMRIRNNYFCPACGMLITSDMKNQIEYSLINNSRIIDLTELSLKPNYEILSSIERFIFVYLYSSTSINIDTLERLLKEELRQYDYDYNRPKMILEKGKKV